MEQKGGAMRYCGRDFTVEEIQWINDTVKHDTGMTRIKLSVRFCRTFTWLKADGGLKEMSCRVAHLRMERDGLIQLPPRKRGHSKPREQVPRTLLALPQAEVHKKAGEYELEIETVDKQWSALWNEFIDRYHYLKYTPLPGAQLRYFVRSEGEVLALLGFGASAWKTKPRDNYIGWSHDQRKKNLHFVVNNARFLILPWIKSKNLGSRILSMTSKRIADDWYTRYKYRPVLLETFVQKDRFTGTCYKASNWIYVGDTQGRGKRDRYNEHKEPIKSVWLYPLMKSFRSCLCK
jgi:hypothetical protein